VNLMARALAIAAIVWPILLGAAVWQRVQGQVGVLSVIVYTAGSQICHQKAERSFHTAGVQWPVCGRCSGLYLSAPFGAIAAMVALRRQRRPLSQTSSNQPAGNSDVRWLMVASLPTVVTFTLEWFGAPMTTLARALAALPLGAAIAFVICRVAAGQPKPIEYTGAR